MPSKRIQASENKQSNDNALTEQIEPVLNNETALTQFKESANVVTQEISGHDYLERISNPFVDQTPTQVLERVYRLATLSWTPGMANQAFTFPGPLVNTLIANYLAPFRYFRAGIKLQIRMNSTPYHQGALMVSSLPTIDAAVGSPTTLWNPYVLSGFKPVVLSASTQDSCVIEFPYLNPVPWLSVSTLSTSAAIGTILISELNELTSTSTGVPASVELLVFGSFTNPKVASYNETVAAQSTGRSRFAFDFLPIPALKHAGDEAKIKNKEGVDSRGIQKVVGGVSEIIKMIPIVGDIYRPIANFISTYGKNLDMPTDTAVTTMVQQYPFQYQNNVRGLFQGDKFTMFPQSAISMDNFSMETSEMSITQLVMTPMLNWRYIYANSGDINTINVHPLEANDATSAFTCDYLAYVAAHHEYWRGSIKYMFHFISSAFYSARFQLSYQLNAGGLIDANLPSQIIDVKGDTITEVTIPFLWNTFWRKTGILGLNTLPSLQLKMITPIAGSSDPSTPIIYVNVWRSGGEDSQFSLLKGSQNTLPWTPATTTKTTTITTGVTQPRAQTSVCSRFQQKFAPINEFAQFSSELGNCMPECTLTVKDILRRFSLIDPRNWQSAADFSYPYSLPFYSPNYFAEPFSAFSNIFLFWRGSRRFRVLSNQCDKIVLNSLDSSFLPTPGSGQVISNFNVTDPNNPYTSPPKTLMPTPTKTEFEVPFFSEVPYLHIYRPVVPFPVTILYDLPVGITVNQYNTATLPPQLTWSGGDDFQYLYLVPPIFPAPTRTAKPRDSKHAKV